MNIKNKIVNSILGLSVLAFTACQETQLEKAPIVQDVQTDNIVRAGANNGQIIPGQYIVVFKDNAGQRISPAATYGERVDIVKSFASKVLDNNGISSTQINKTFGKAILGISGEFTKAEIGKLANDPSVDYIEPNRMISISHNAEAFRGKPGGGGGGSASQSTPWGISRVGGVSNYSGSGVAWVIDTGIDVDHEDLNVDAGRGFSAFTKGKDSGVDDGNGHGTHVAGTIGALNNSVGVIGVAPGATVIPVKVLDSRGSGGYDGVIAGVDWVAANASNGDVANMSLGGPASSALDAAIQSAASSGIKFALAAGNEAQDANNVSPARINGSNIYTISASDVNDNFASFSNYGNPPVDYCEPGVSINSTWKGGGYSSISGTSMASPHAAGLLLLGNISNGGNVNGDPDGNADTIGVN